MTRLTLIITLMNPFIEFIHAFFMLMRSELTLFSPLSFCLSEINFDDEHRFREIKELHSHNSIL